MLWEYISTLCFSSFDFCSQVVGRNTVNSMSRLSLPTYFNNLMSLLKIVFWGFTALSSQLLLAVRIKKIKPRGHASYTYKADPHGGDCVPKTPLKALTSSPHRGKKVKEKNKFLKIMLQKVWGCFNICYTPLKFSPRMLWLYHCYISKGHIRYGLSYRFLFVKQNRDL